MVCRWPLSGRVTDLLGVLMRALFVVTEDWYFASHRLALGRALRERGWRVGVACRRSAVAEALEAEGIEVLPIGWQRGSVRPWREAATVLELARLLRQWQPDLVHCVAIKPVAYGGLAMRLALYRGPRVHAVAGLGFSFASRGMAARLVRPLVRVGLRTALRGERVRVIVQNPDDRAALGELMPEVTDAVRLVRGSGVDVRALRPLSEPRDSVVRCALVARMLREKGVLEAVEAGRRLQAEGVPARIVLVGAPDPENPGSVREADLRGWAREGVVEWWGHVSDIASVWGRCQVALLPSYREGLPKALLEAAACGRPLVASDVPGCREIVRPGKTGLLVPPKDPAALAQAIRQLVDDPALRRSLGAGARAVAETEFAVERIVSETLTVYRELVGPERLSD